MGRDKEQILTELESISRLQEQVSREAQQHATAIETGMHMFRRLQGRAASLVEELQAWERKH